MLFRSRRSRGRRREGKERTASQMIPHATSSWCSSDRPRKSASRDTQEARPLSTEGQAVKGAEVCLREKVAFQSQSQRARQRKGTNGRASALGLSVDGGVTDGSPALGNAVLVVDNNRVDNRTRARTGTLISGDLHEDKRTRLTLHGRRRQRKRRKRNPSRG